LFLSDFKKYGQGNKKDTDSKNLGQKFMRGYCSMFLIKP